MWGNFWTMKGLQGVKASIPESKWQAQWMQQPTSEEGALIKREWWQTWEEDTIPHLKYIIQSYDTAFSAKETADYSAITTWGVFEPEEGGPQALILLDAKKGRWIVISRHFNYFSLYALKLFRQVTNSVHKHK